jgi:hypothetical protein
VLCFFSAVVTNASTMSVIENEVQIIKKKEEEKKKVMENISIVNKPKPKITKHSAGISLLHSNVNPPPNVCFSNANLTTQSGLITDLSPISSIKFSREMVSQFSFLESDEENEIQQIPRNFLFFCLQFC